MTIKENYSLININSLGKKFSIRCPWGPVELRWFAASLYCLGNPECLIGTESRVTLRKSILADTADCFWPLKYPQRKMEMVRLPWIRRRSDLQTFQSPHPGRCWFSKVSSQLQNQEVITAKKVITNQLTFNSTIEEWQSNYEALSRDPPALGEEGMDRW